MSDIFMEIVQEKFDRKLKEETDKAVAKAVDEAVAEQTKITATKTRLTECISLIQRKYAKNKPLPVIADELETESDKIRPIYNIIAENPEKTTDEIYELMFE